MERRSPTGTRPAGPPQTPRKSLLLRASIHDPGKRRSHLGPLPQRPGSPESERATAGTSTTLERTRRQVPGPRAAPSGAAAGTHNTFGPLPGAPPPDHDHRRDADQRALLDDHGRRRIGRRRAADPNRRLAGSPLAEVRFRAGSGEESTAAGPLRSRSATQLEPPPLLLGLLRIAVGATPFSPSRLCSGDPALRGQGRGCKRPPLSWRKTAPSWSACRTLLPGPGVACSPRPWRE